MDTDATQCSPHTPHPHPCAFNLRCQVHQLAVAEDTQRPHVNGVQHTESPSTLLETPFSLSFCARALLLHLSPLPSSSVSLGPSSPGFPTVVFPTLLSAQSPPLGQADRHLRFHVPADAMLLPESTFGFYRNVTHPRDLSSRSITSIPHFSQGHHHPPGCPGWRAGITLARPQPFGSGPSSPIHSSSHCVLNPVTYARWSRTVCLGSNPVPAIYDYVTGLVSGPQFPHLSNGTK